MHSVRLLAFLNTADNMDTTFLIALITAMAALVGAASPMIVALIQANKEKQKQVSGILLPVDVKLHRPKIQFRWSTVLLFSSLFGIAGYGLARIANPGPSTSQSITPESTGIPPAAIQVSMPTAWFMETAKTFTDPSALCNASAQRAQLPDREKAVRIEFNADQGGYCSWVILLNGYNASLRQQVTFWVKGEKGGEQYLVGIKDTYTESGKEPKISKTASAAWEQVSIPLDEFTNQNIAALDNFSLSFVSGSGIIFVDELIFTP